MANSALAQETPSAPRTVVLTSFIPETWETRTGWPEARIQGCCELLSVVINACWHEVQFSHKNSCKVQPGNCGFKYRRVRPPNKWPHSLWGEAEGWDCSAFVWVRTSPGPMVAGWEWRCCRGRVGMERLKNWKQRFVSLSVASSPRTCFPSPLHFLPGDFNPSLDSVELFFLTGLTSPAELFEQRGWPTFVSLPSITFASSLFSPALLPPQNHVLHYLHKSYSK